jgi:hypothetical protein
VGLDVVAYRSAVLTEPHPKHRGLRGPGAYPRVPSGFEQSFRGLLWERCYECRGRSSISLPAATANTRSSVRCSPAPLNVDADDIYADPGPFRDKPFFELIYFADT